MPRVTLGLIRTIADVERTLRQWYIDLNSNVQWRGILTEDPDPVSPGDVWIRSDLGELRVCGKGEDGSNVTYAISAAVV
jgi:hypothetical protein